MLSNSLLTFKLCFKGTILRFFYLKTRLIRSSNSLLKLKTRFYPAYSQVAEGCSTHIHTKVVRQVFYTYIIFDVYRSGYIATLVSVKFGKTKFPKTKFLKPLFLASEAPFTSKRQLKFSYSFTRRTSVICMYLEILSSLVGIIHLY